MPMKGSFPQPFTYRRQATFPFKSFRANLVAVVLDQLVEDVVGPLHLLLLSDARLLKKVAHDVTTGQLTGSCNNI